MGIRDRTAWQKRLGLALQPLGSAYGLLMRCRGAAYTRGWLASWRPPIPCISVGNINWGGSGKSPLCSELLGWSLERGLRPALLTRGYKARPPELPYLVKTGSPVEESGDEPLMLVRQTPGALVVVDPERSRSGRWICSRHEPDLLILDDAFQHLAVARDVDLVILTAEDVLQDWNRVLPAGTWRESRQALERASALLLNVSPGDFRQHRPRFQERLDGLGKPIYSFFPTGRGLKRLGDGLEAPAPEGRYLLVSAVGAPQRVEKTAIELIGRPPAEHLAYHDHHFFSQADWLHIRDRADRLGCTAVLCTPKDGVKLERWAEGRVFTFDVDLEFGPFLNAAMAFWDWLDKQLA